MAALNTLSVAGPNYSYIFEFERDFEHTEAKAWMVANWRTVCFYSGGLYLLLVFVGQQVCHFACNSEQGDQIGRIFAFWKVLYIGQFFQNSRSSAIF
jgi:hypothetical protein